MINIAAMMKIPELPEAELFNLFTGAKALEKKIVSFKLSKEARRIIEEEAKRYNTDKTKALEIVLREIRELRKRKR